MPFQIVFNCKRRRNLIKQKEFICFLQTDFDLGWFTIKI